MIKETTKDIVPTNSMPEVCYQRAQEFNEEVTRLDGIAHDYRLQGKKNDIANILSAFGMSLGESSIMLKSKISGSGKTFYADIHKFW